jgi:GrpB-like predicted nucleotidyltransferase (UPF0157 family)
MPSDEEITRFHEDPPSADPWVPGQVNRPYQIRVVEYDDRWPADFDLVAGIVRAALGDRVLEIHHVGSTSVVGLPAKPVIDVDLVVADPADEPSYLPDLEAVGFVHRIREPWWHEHRLLTYADPVAHLHVFGHDCPEVVRHQMFQAWLREHPDDLTAYAEAKRAAAAEMNERPGGGTGMDYNRRDHGDLRRASADRDLHLRPRAPATVVLGAPPCQRPAGRPFPGRCRRRRGGGLRLLVRLPPAARLPAHP